MSTLSIESEIAGKVWKIEVSPGDEVDEDDTLIILESMKMEIPIVAPKSGKVVSITVSEGEEVAEGQIVAQLDNS